MKEQEDFLDELAPEPAAEAATPEPVATAADPTESKGPARGPDGKFAKSETGEKLAQSEAVTETADESADASGTPPEQETPHVPRAALEAERKKRQALEAELAKLRTPSAQSQSQQTPKGPEFAPPQVDFERDPKGFIQEHLLTERLNTSRYFAIQQFSEPEVNAAWDDFDKAASVDPQVYALSVKLRSHPHPIGEIVSWHRKQQQIRQIDEAGSLEALIERAVAARLAQQGQSAPAAQQSVTPVQPVSKPQTPPSLSRGAGVNSAPDIAPAEEEFEAFFSKR